MQNRRSANCLIDRAQLSPNVQPRKRHVSQNDQVDGCKTVPTARQSDQQVAGETQNPIRAELFGSDQCRAEGIVARGNAPVLELCRKLIAEGYDPSALLHVYRGDKLALRISSIGSAAASEINSKGTGLIARSPVRRGPPVRQIPPGILLSAKGTK